MPERKTKTVVSNTTPLITLTSIDKLDILKELYGKVYIPNAVLNEIKAGKGKIGYFEIDTIDWIIPQKITNVFSMNYLIDLDDGEAETIILAEELQADIVLIDEKFARGFAEIRGLTLSGSLGVLLEAKKKGIISQVKPLIEKMLANRRYLSEKIILDLLKSTNELDR
jgi:predicted nucleic acid-binding protein